MDDFVCVVPFRGKKETLILPIRKMAKKTEVSRKELLQRWGVIEQEDDADAVHPVKRRRLRQLKEQWLPFASARPPFLFFFMSSFVLHSLLSISGLHSWVNYGGTMFAIKKND